MLRRAISTVLLPVMLMQLSGCTKTVWVGPDEIRPERDKIKAVRTIDGEKVSFDARPQPAVEGDTIYASVGDQPYQVAIARIESASVKRANVAGQVVTSVLLIGLVLTVTTGIMVFASWEGPMD